MVKIGPVVFELNWGRKRKLKFDDCRPFGMLAFRNGLENGNFDFRRVIGNHCCTSFRNLV